MSTLTLKNSWGSFFDEPFFVDVFDIFNPRLKVNYPYDVYSNDEGAVIEVPLAGYKKENISLSVEDKILKLKVGSNSDIEKPDTKYSHKGISRRTLSLSWNLADAFQEEAISTSFENGLLTISLKKSEKKEKKRVIEIQ